MKTRQGILIKAPLKKVYAAAARIEAWPGILSHYRWVHILRAGRVERLVDMAAWRDGFPCRWQSRQVLHPGKAVYFLHTKSFWTQGMEVWWRFKKVKGGMTLVSLDHDQAPSSNPFLEWFRQHVVGELFVENIAAKTMAGLKRHLEAGT